MNYQDWLERNFNKSEDFVLITGASSGIGLEFLRLFSAAGCNCLAVSDEAEKLQEISKDFERKFGVSVSPIFCDLSSPSDLEKLGEQLSMYSVKVLVNNAGFGLKGAFVGLSQREYQKIVLVNSLAPTLLSRMVLPGMLAKGAGLHISVATINVVSPIPFNAVYTATKFYVFAYALAIAHENRNSGVLFQVVLPGTTNTPFHEKQGTRPTAMVMAPDTVAQRSLANVCRLICIPNRADYFLYLLGGLIPIGIRMRLAALIAKKRLGMGA